MLEPAGKNVEDVAKIVNRFVAAINEFVTNLNNGKFDEAEGILGDARGREQQSLDLLAGRDSSGVFQRFLELGKEDIALVEQLLQIGFHLIQSGRASPESQSPEYRTTLDEWNDIVTKVTANIGASNKLIPELAKEARKRP
jgi:hypothetical protein